MATRTQPLNIFWTLFLFAVLVFSLLGIAVYLAPFVWTAYIIFWRRPNNASRDISRINLEWQKPTLEGFRTFDSKIYLLIVPLAFSHSSGLSLASEPGAGSFLNFKSLQHWAILVGNVVYEVRRNQKTGGHELSVMYFTSLEHWRAGCTVQMACLGQTPYGPRTRENIARGIWKTFHQQKYNVLNQNCQTFAWLFFNLIHKGDATVNIKVLNDQFFPPRLSKTVYKVIVAISIVMLLSTLKWVCFGYGISFLSGAHFLCCSITILSLAPDVVRLLRFLEYLEDTWWQQLAVKRFEERKKQREILVSQATKRIRNERRFWQVKKWMKRSKDEAEKLYEKVDFAMVLEEWSAEAEIPVMEADLDFLALQSGALKNS